MIIVLPVINMVQPDINNNFKDRLTISSLRKKLESNPLNYRFAKNTYWSLFGTIFSRIFALFTTIIVSRLLGVDKYGVYGMVQSTLGMFGLLAGIGMGGTLTKYISEYKYKDKIKTRNIINLTNTLSLITSGSMMIIVIALSSWLSNNILKRAEMTNFLISGGILLFVSSQSSVKIGGIAGFENFKSIAKLNLCQAILTLVFVFPFTYFLEVQGAIISLILSTTVTYVYAIKLLYVECNKCNINMMYYDRESFKELYIIWKYSIPSVVNALCIIIPIWVSNTILVNQSNGYSELGLFNASNQWRTMVLFLPHVLSAVSMPILSDIYGQNNNKEDFLKAFKISKNVTWVVSLPITVFIIILRNPISKLFGSQFQSMSFIVVILMVTSFISVLNSSIGTTLLSIGKVWILNFFQILCGVFLIIISYFLSPVYGGTGLAIAYLIATIIMTVSEILYFELKISPSTYFEDSYTLFLSLFLLIIIVYVCYYNYDSLYISSIIAILSLIPLSRHSLKYIRK